MIDVTSDIGTLELTHQLDSTIVTFPPLAAASSSIRPVVRIAQPSSDFVRQRLSAGLKPKILIGNSYRGQSLPLRSVKIPTFRRSPPPSAKFPSFHPSIVKKKGKQQTANSKRQSDKAKKRKSEKAKRRPRKRSTAERANVSEAGTGGEPVGPPSLRRFGSKPIRRSA